MVRDHNREFINDEVFNSEKNLLNVYFINDNINDNNIFYTMLKTFNLMLLFISNIMINNNIFLKTLSSLNARIIKIDNDLSLSLTFLILMNLEASVTVLPQT